MADLRNALLEEREVNVSILNYSKAQTPFWNQLYLRPVRNGQHILQFYIGVSRHNGEAPQITHACKPAALPDHAASPRVHAEYNLYATQVSSVGQVHGACP